MNLSELRARVTCRGLIARVRKEKATPGLGFSINGLAEKLGAGYAPWLSRMLVRRTRLEEGRSESEFKQVQHSAISSLNLCRGGGSGQ